MSSSCFSALFPETPQQSTKAPQHHSTVAPQHRGHKKHSTAGPNPQMHWLTSSPVEQHQQNDKRCPQTGRENHASTHTAFVGTLILTPLFRGSSRRRKRCHAVSPPLFILQFSRKLMAMCFVFAEGKVFFRFLLQRNKREGNQGQTSTQK